MSETTNIAWPPGGRIVCNFSCGAASAVATKIAIAEHPGREIAS